MHNFINKLKNEEGYVALMSVLIISAIGVIVSLSLLIGGMSYQRSVLALEQEYSTRALAKACANVALNKIRLNADYLGDENIVFDYGSCLILPINKNQNTYSINTQGVVDSFLHKNKIVVLRNTDPVSLSIQSWQEVADF
jgi:hypothetical protein